VITFERNQDTAKRVARHLGADILIYDKDAFRRAFEAYDAIVPIFATGIVVREIAPLLVDKWSDPAVIVVDSNLTFAIPITGGHHGANELARKLSELGAVPVITTSTEVHNRPSVEGIASDLQCEIVNRESTRSVNCALLEEDVEVLEIRGPKVVVVDDDVSVLKRQNSKLQVEK
jgi:cobalt-precorrin 5A hydrolase